MALISSGVGCCFPFYQKLSQQFLNWAGITNRMMIQTCNLRNTGAMLYQLSYGATNCKQGPLIEFNLSSCEE